MLHKLSCLMNKGLFFILFAIFPCSIYGKAAGVYTGDSLHYLTLQDTIFLQSGLYSEKVFTHIIEPKQTLYSLSRFYGLTLEELYFYNPENEGGRYEVGSEIKIPIPNRSIIRYRPANFDALQFVPVFYVVKKGETMYHVARRLFKLPIDTLMNRNQLESPTLSIGQTLWIGWMSIHGVPDNYRQFRGHPLWKKSYELRKQYLVAKRGKREYRRRGPAVLIKGIKSSSDLIVMHRYARVGSIIAVTNPMKRRTVYAKVVAKMPATYSSNIEVVVSPRVGKMLGAIDEKFFVKVKYLR